MIKGEHLHKEITILGETAKTSKDPLVLQKAQLTADILALKLLLNIRQNQVAIMTAQGIELIKPNRQNGAVEEVKE